MSWSAEIGAWTREHPRVSDVLLAVFVAIPALTVPADAPYGLAPSTPLSIALIVASCAALVFRRPRPMAVLVITLAIAVVAIAASDGPTGAIFPVLVALYSYAVRTNRRNAILAGLATAVIVIGELGALDGWQTPTTYVVLAWSALAVALGIAVQNTRVVVAAAVDRAKQAEESREGEARRRVAEERLRIARELHDVVAHHIAVINVQSGVALHLLDAQPQSARAALGHVREASQVVLSEMSSLLGVLRTGDEGPETQPASGLAGLADLVDSMRRTGLQVTVHEEGPRTSLAPLSDLAAFRLVQESLTNAHKHGTGTADLRIRYGGSTTVIEVGNPVAHGASGDGGLGLVGMRERVAASGGQLRAGPDGRGRFVVRAELPSSAGRATR